MATPHPALTPRHRAFISAQPLFFVATAPLAADGHVNLSPKGLDGSFAVLDDTTVAYLDLTGSGIETLAHLRENGRICLMFCAFTGPPNIPRLHGNGDAVEPHHDDFDRRAQAFPDFDRFPGVRSIVRVRLMDLVGQRTKLTEWATKKGPEGVGA